MQDNTNKTLKRIMPTDGKAVPRISCPADPKSEFRFYPWDRSAIREDILRRKAMNTPPSQDNFPEEQPQFNGEPDSNARRPCLMTVWQGQADSRSLDKLNRLLHDGWRIAGIDPAVRRLPGVGKATAFLVELVKPSHDSE
jgi:hypothetical protein